MRRRKKMKRPFDIVQLGIEPRCYRSVPNQLSHGGARLQLSAMFINTFPSWHEGTRICYHRHIARSIIIIYIMDSCRQVRSSSQNDSFMTYSTASSGWMEPMTSRSFHIYFSQWTTSFSSSVRWYFCFWSDTPELSSIWWTTTNLRSHKCVIN